jgi:hypothetical protein
MKHLIHLSFVVAIAVVVGNILFGLVNHFLIG